MKISQSVLLSTILLILSYSAFADVTIFWYPNDGNTTPHLFYFNQDGGASSAAFPGTMMDGPTADGFYYYTIVGATQADIVLSDGSGNQTDDIIAVSDGDIIVSPGNSGGTNSNISHTLYDETSTSPADAPSVSPATDQIWIKVRSDQYCDGRATNPNFPDDTSFDILPSENSSPYIQAQVFGDIGFNNNTCGNNTTSDGLVDSGSCNPALMNVDGQSIACNNDAGCGTPPNGTSNACASGGNGFPDANGVNTTCGSNFPSSARQDRSITITDWTNTNPESAISAGATEGCVFQQTNARVSIGGHGHGGDDNWIDVIGGGTGTSEFTTTVTSQMSWSATGPSGEMIMGDSDPVTTTGTVEVNDANTGNMYRWNQGGSGDPTQWDNWFNGNGGHIISITDDPTDEYTVTSAENGGTFDITFSATSSISVTRGFGNADARVSHSPGMEASAQYCVDYDVWKISPTEANILPVKLSSFEAELNNNFVELTWTTESEVNNDRFEIERSIDGISWDIIGTVPGNGTTSQRNSYRFTDSNIPNPTFFYRLNQIDIDGQNDYSDIIEVDASTIREDVLIFPNPAREHLNLKINNSVIRYYSIFNSKGELVNQSDIVEQPLQVNGEQFSISIAQFSRGMHFIIFYDKNHKVVETQKVLFH